MILLYPHTLLKYKDLFEKLNEFKSKNAFDEWNKIKLRNPKRKLMNNNVIEGISPPEKKESTTKSGKSFKDEASQTKFILKKNQETSYSPIKLQENSKETIFEENPHDLSVMSTPTSRKLSAIGVASKARKRNHNISLLDENSNSSIFENRDSETFTNITHDLNKRKRADVTMYKDDLSTNINKKLKDDYRVIEKDGVVYTVVGDPEDIHDNGDVHDIIEESNEYYKEKKVKTPSPVASRLRSKIIQTPDQQMKSKKQIKWDKL